MLASTRHRSDRENPNGGCSSTSRMRSADRRSPPSCFRSTADDDELVAAPEPVGPERVYTRIAPRSPSGHPVCQPARRQGCGRSGPVFTIFPLNPFEGGRRRRGRSAIPFCAGLAARACFEQPSLRVRTPVHGFRAALLPSAKAGFFCSRTSGVSGSRRYETRSRPRYVPRGVANQRWAADAAPPTTYYGAGPLAASRCAGPVSGAWRRSFGPRDADAGASGPVVAS